uniref:Sulfite dehydrogenase (Cytochrome) subunit SorB n=1 Tax=Candidatus Kentrum eta TaxID=2126337 RepID=A0A450V923_9GAMM|nr:MAG: hypothetical protein BECKH772B_GA0070898_100478 [Candidatus Kentron sp. H]VFJ94040.1 MAG: hypothetical protein BECKH772A_GA0070896_100658 [Candidatus Kentron sp. H]VFK01249.1 MAG: hypothetical protein BECKH772C_GA0070978_100617 [Candidatus Kentron sp. H]
MLTIRRTFVAVCGAVLFSLLQYPVSGAESAPGSLAGARWGGLPPGPGREDVFYTCQICHSLAIVKQQALDRSAWDETLTWMVEEQGMREPDAERRRRILDYLATHFGSGP